jgi:hypothetical protein
VTTQSRTTRAPKPAPKGQTIDPQTTADAQAFVKGWNTGLNKVKDRENQ